jgi:uncharacterized protein (TIGR03435 family)
MTYGLGMEDGTRVRGGPDWVRSEKYTIAAVAGIAVDAATLQRTMLLSGAAAIRSLADLLTLASHGPVSLVNDLNGLLVLDRTGIPDTDTFNYVLQYGADEGAGAQFGIPSDIGAGVARAPEVFDALEQQLGLKLERAQGAREFLVIDHIERPPEN